MGEKTGIEWTDQPGYIGATWNPWMGCHKVSPACAHCYAEREMTRYGRDFDMPIRTKNPTFFAPLKWKEPHCIFTCSWSDFFIEEADGWRGEAWNVIMQTPRHRYLVLTKRTNRIATSRLEWPTHIWLGASVETPRQYGRIDDLREIPARIRFLSMEPLLARTMNTNLSGIHWVIVGTESGPNPRTTDLKWIRGIRDKCKDEGVAFFLKQLTTVGGIQIPYENWPPDLRIREYPQQ
jgi:protein gp37